MSQGRKVSHNHFCVRAWPVCSTLVRKSEQAKGRVSLKATCALANPLPTLIMHMTGSILVCKGLHIPHELCLT